MVEYNHRFFSLCLCLLTKTGGWGGVPHVCNCPAFSKWGLLSGGTGRKHVHRMQCSEVDKKVTSCQQGAPICSHIVSHPALGDKSQSTALSSTEAKWTRFSIMPESVTKARGSEWNMKSPLPLRQTDGQRHSLLFPALCLPSTFGISFRKLEVMT